MELIAEIEVNPHKNEKGEAVYTITQYDGGKVLKSGDSSDSRILRVGVGTTDEITRE